MAEIGYARVSTQHQSLEQQHDALLAVGVERIFDDVMSGAREDRPGLEEMLSYAREGDRLTVVALDRLGRSMTCVMRTIETLHKRTIYLRSIREDVDFSTSMGRMMAGIFASLAQYERDLIRERGAARAEAVRARGGHVGRPPKLDPAQVKLARRMRDAGESVATICETLGVSPATFYRAVGKVDA